MIKQCIFVLCVSLHAWLLFSHIVETSSLSTVLEYLSRDDASSNTLVIFDVDNVLGTMDRLIGSPEWFYYTIEQQIESGLAPEDALARVLPLYHAIQYQIWMVPIEPTVSDIVKKIQNEARYVVAMSSRGFHLSRRTQEQLVRLDIDFSETTFFNSAIYRTYECYQGIIVCNGNNKGSILIDILKRCNYIPEKIIFINDKRKHLETVEQAIIKNEFTQSIEYIGVHYTDMNRHQESFNILQAEKELLLLMGNKYHTLSY